MAYGRDRYDVELVVAAFDGPLWETMQLVHRTDLLLGMHGAGLTNMMFLSNVRCCSWAPPTPSILAVVLPSRARGWQVPSCAWRGVWDRGQGH